MRISDEQRDLADRTDIVSFLHSMGEQVKREGNGYRWPDHLGTFINGSKWCQHGVTTAEGKHPGGGAIKFVMNFYGKSFPEAVRMLLANDTFVVSSPVTHTPPADKRFVLPPKHTNNDAVIRYLQQVRRIDPKVINLFVQRGDIYEEYTQKYHNAVFVGRDSTGTARSASRKGTTGTQFRRDVYGSRKEFGFGSVGTDETVVFFEAAIDLLSFLVLFPEAKTHSLISLGGTSDKAAQRFLSDHPDTQHIILALDNDAAGDAACSFMMKSFPSYYNVCRYIPRLKDWNVILQNGDTANAYTVVDR